MKDSAVRNPPAAHRPRGGHVQPARLQQLTVPGVAMSSRHASSSSPSPGWPRPAGAPSAAHRPHQKRKRVRRRRIFRAVARCALSVTEAGPLFPDSFFGVDTPLSSSPRGLLSLGESPRGELHKGRFQLQGKTRNVQGGHDGKFGNGNHHSDEGSRRRPAELLASACWHDENAFL